MKLRNGKSTTRQYSQTIRARAAEETGERIVAAFLQRFLVGWFDEITLDQVAQDADVTVMTVVRRFGGKDGLLQAALQVLGQQINARRQAPAGDVERSLDNLFYDYEQTGDAVLRMLALEQRHPALKKFLDYGRTQHRAWVTQAFEARLAGLQGAAREGAIDMLVIATDVYTWKLLRRDMGGGKGMPAALEMMKTLVGSVLAGTEVDVD